MFLISVLEFFSFKPYPNYEDKVILDRIEYIYNLKIVIDKNTWKGFTDKKFDLPLVYYTDQACYVANPTERFISSFQPNLIYENKDLKIYKTNLLDSIPFHMETGMLLGDSTAAYNYKSPFMNCSSFEITQRSVPDVNATEQWATMVIHEYFHGFQFKHPAFVNYFEKNIAVVPEDSLKKIYKAHLWFKEGVDQENEMLLAAIGTADESQIKSLVNKFFQLREQRRLQTRQQLNFDIKLFEQTFETMEGTARYVEYSLYRHFGKKKPSIKLIRSDSAYQAYEYFRNYNIEKDQWLYLTDKTTYFYATGFNMARLLDKLKVKYKERLFNEGDLSLEQLLKQHWAN